MGRAAAAGIPLEYDEVGNIATQLNPQQMEALNGMAGELGLQVYAQPIEVETGGDDWIPFNQKKVPAFQVHSIVPAAGGMESGGQAQQDQGANSPAMDMPEPKQAPDGNFYVPDPNRQGKYLKVKQPAQGSGAPAQQTQESAAKDLLKNGTRKAQPSPQAEATPAKQIPKTRADLQFAEDFKKRAEQFDGALSKIGLGLENWKAAFNSPLIRGKAHLDDMWDAYMKFVNMVADAYSPEELSSEAAQKRVREMANSLTPKG
jgi:hypothetical protein